MIGGFRFAHPTASLERIEAFYGGLLGLSRLGSFSGHDGYDGIMFGLPDARVHLEFTYARNEMALPEWSAESLFVLYVPNKTDFEKMLQSLDEASARRVSSRNPYWDNKGTTFLDPDGRRVVIFNSAGL